MWLVDLTHFIKNEMENYYVFNPSMICLSSHMMPFISHSSYVCVMVYRLASYNIYEKYHPWKIWDNGYKYFMNPEKVKREKYRDTLGSEIKLELKSSKLKQSTFEYDSTGIAIFTFDGNEFRLKYNIPNLFNDEMNQDARLSYIDDVFYVTYNVFENVENPRLKMRYRTMKIDDKNIHLSDEKYMFEHVYKSVEKNCTFDHKLRVQYEIGSKYSIIDNDILIHKQSPLDDFVKYYGDKNIFFSLSTPSVEYNNEYLCCGHVKVMYKNMMDKYPFSEFVSKINFNEIHKHGKYIYFMFLYTYNENGITSVSPPFIPTTNDNHLPYLLVMPCGLTKIDDKYVISYGEGDCKSKLLFLSKKELNYLLSYRSNPCNNQSDNKYGFYFLTESLRIMHVGYWNHKNCGDDAFVEIFKYLRDTYYPQNEIIFVGSAQRTNIKFNPHVMTLGGGDVITKYFLDGINYKNTVAFGVGIPYSEFNDCIYKFNKCYLRNYLDYQKLKKGHASIKYIPDLAFLLPKIYGRNCKIRSIKNKKSLNIGIIPIRNYYNSCKPYRYIDFVESMANFADMMVEASHNVYFIPFCYGNFDEDDRIVINDIMNKMNMKAKKFDSDNVKNIYEMCGKMDFNICTRFHSHIFSTIHHVPFISLTCGRKCIEYMKETQNDSIYLLRSDEDDLPYKFDPRELYNFFISKLDNYDKIHSHLKNVSTEYEKIIDSIVPSFGKILREAAVSSDICLYPSLCNNNPSSPPICNDNLPLSRVHENDKKTKPDDIKIHKSREMHLNGPTHHLDNKNPEPNCGNDNDNLQPTTSQPTVNHNQQPVIQEQIMIAQQPVQYVQRPIIQEQIMIAQQPVQYVQRPVIQEQSLVSQPVIKIYIEKNSDHNVNTQSSISQTSINQNVTNQSISNQNMLSQSMLNQNMLSQSMLNQNMLSQSMLNQNMLNQSLINQSMLNQSMMNQSMLNQSMMNQSMLNQSMSNQSMLNQSMTNQSMTNQSMTNQNMLSQSMMNQTSMNQKYDESNINCL